MLQSGLLAPLAFGYLYVIEVGSLSHQPCLDCLFLFCSVPLVSVYSYVNVTFVFYMIDAWSRCRGAACYSFLSLLYLSTMVVSIFIEM